MITKWQHRDMEISLSRNAYKTVIIPCNEICDITLCDQVILCGGAVNSPQLLLLSGIGPADELRRHKIQLQHHSPGVGINLQNHLRIDLQYRCTKPVTFNLNQV